MLAYLGILLSLVMHQSVAGVPDVVYRSAVTWEDANWPSELGSMPLGNGDIALNVWVDTNGDLYYYIAKSDAFDANANPIKVGRIMIALDPPLWVNGATYNQTLNVAEASISITTNTYNILIFADINSNTVYVSVNSVNDQTFSVSATIQIYRDAVTASNLGWGLCYPFYQTPDTVLTDLPLSMADSVVWYHRNYYPNSTYNYYNNTMWQQGIDPSVMADPFINRTFGGVIYASPQLTKTNATTLTGSDLGSVLIATIVHTNQASNEGQWLSDVILQQQQQQGLNVSSVYASHVDGWASLWSRSYVDIASPPNGNYSQQTLDQINFAYVWQRFLDLCDGRYNSPIKFNGQSFTVDVGSGPDYRDWGASYWWQNTRQPYYNALVTGDLDLLRTMYSAYIKALPIVKNRVAVEYNNISGAVWPESTTQFGLYNPNDWGCDTTPQGPSTNCYMRYHYTGSLELCMILLDDYIITGDLDVLTTYGIPIISSVLQFFEERFPNIDPDTQRIDMFPAQALETWQCPDPSSRTACVTNPVTDIAGLIAVINRALALPANLIEPYTASWSKLLQNVPEFTYGTKFGVEVILPGAQLPSGTSNSENTELYTVHPFRLYGVGKPNISVAINSYNTRQFPCNDGWCQDVIDAAMLGLSFDAADQVLQRAQQPPATGWRFDGFSQHYQDYEPSLDHLSFMRTAIHYMLMSPLDDEAQTIQLFAGWPVGWWDVSFKLNGPLNTTVEASCVGGKLAYLNVTPESRASDVVVLNCQQ